MNILVVDSDPIQLQSLSRGLKSSGYLVVTAANLTEAFALLDEADSQIQLILTDLKSPQLDAFALAKKARANNRLFPIIIMTTYISSELQKQIQHESHITLIEKPFFLEKLLQEVERLNHPGDFSNHINV